MNIDELNEYLECTCGRCDDGICQCRRCDDEQHCPSSFEETDYDEYTENPDDWE